MNWTDMVLTTLDGEFMGFTDGFFGFGREIVKVGHSKRFLMNNGTISHVRQSALTIV
jgi:hypothetical protein